MELIKPKYNIGDEVYYIYSKSKTKSTICGLCGHRHEEKEIREWDYDAQLVYINQITANFESEIISYSLALYSRDKYGFLDWEFEYCGTEEENIFKTLEEAIKTCEERNELRSNL